MCACTLIHTHTHTHIYIYIYIYRERERERDWYHHHHHHHVMPLARISLTLSRHFSLSFIASGRSSGLHPVSSHSCCMYVRAGRPTFAWQYAGVHRSTSLMSSSLCKIIQSKPLLLGIQSKWMLLGIIYYQTLQYWNSAIKNMNM